MKVELNRALEELYHQVTAQVRAKLPGTNSTLGDIVKRIMDGLHECFELQAKSLNTKIEVRNKKIESLKEELLKLKDDFHHFKKNSTMDAYFAKHTDLVDRRGRGAKYYMKDLVQVTEDYLGNQTKVDEKRIITKDIEPSGVNTLLLQL